MLSLLFDHDFGEPIVRGLVSRLPTVDLLRARDVALSRASDPDFLLWAASHHRVIVSHDENTLVGHAYQRVARGLPMPGVLIVHQSTPIGPAIEELSVAVYCLEPAELKDTVRFISLS